VRVGIFATASSARHDAGAGYYGVMNLADNVSEFVVNTGDTTGRAFINEPGDGNEWTLASTWPNNSNGYGEGLRGGSFSSATSQSQVSDRSAMMLAWNYYSYRYSTIGGRGVRMAP
jgi:hypothetical protein